MSVDRRDLNAAHGAARAMLDLQGWKKVGLIVGVIDPVPAKPHGGIVFEFTLLDESQWEVAFSGLRFANPAYELSRMAIFAAERLDAYLNLAPVPPHPSDLPAH